MALSILHRMTGVGLSIGLIFFAVWLMAAASGPDEYRSVADLFGSLPGKLLLIAWSAAFFLHLGNGIRHLVWDTGRGFETSQASASGWLVIGAAAGLTAAFWVLL